MSQRSTSAAFSARIRPPRPPHRLDQLRHTNDRHHAHRDVGEGVQRHLGRHVLHLLHLEVRRACPRLDRAQGMFDRFAGRWNLARIIVKPLLNALENVRVLTGGRRHSASRR